MAISYVALLRGINLGSKNRLPMPDLAGMFAESGCEDVRTYIQSGNVVFRAAPEKAETIPEVVSTAIAERCGYRVPVVLRTAEQMEEVVANNPFLSAGAGEDALHVMFLDGVPEPGRVAGLDQERSKPDAFSVRGQDIYLWLPNGVARTKLTNDYFDTKLGRTSTGRNWRTVLTLLKMMRE